MASSSASMEKPELGLEDLSSSNQSCKSLPLPKAAPWLVIPYGKGEKFQAFYNISEPNNTNCRKFIPELKGKSAYQKNCHQGWLIILCDDDEIDYTPWNYGDCFLLNPLSMETVNLPSFLYWRTLDGYIFNDCVLTSHPKTSRDGNGNSMVFMLFTRVTENGEGILVFCHPGDKEWTTYMIAEDIYELRSLCYFKGKLYIMCFGDEHLEIEIQHEFEPTILSISKIQVSQPMGGVLDSEFLTYYVETSDEIFKVVKIFIIRGVYHSCITNMMVSKLDFSSMSWVEVTSLDHHVLFISGSTRLCCAAKELGFTRGYVYFTQPGEMCFYMYDLEDKTVMLSLPCPDIPKPWFSPNWLMIPTTIWANPDRRSGIESMSISTRTSINNDEEKEDTDEVKLWDMFNQPFKSTKKLWDILDDDLVSFILSYLSPLDYMHLRAVCRSYRSRFPIVNLRRFFSTRRLQTTVLSPWMFFAKDNESVYSFINPMHNDENYFMSIPETLKGSTIRFSKGGWLLMSKGHHNFFFYNPFTKAIIGLPNFPDGSNGHINGFRGISFSSLPTSSDCVVFAISNVDSDDMEDSVFISFIKRGDKIWTCGFVGNVYLPPIRTKMDFEPSLNSPIFYNGAFYCLDQNGTLGVFTLENGTRWEVLSMVSPPLCGGFIYKCYLVEHEGNLLSVLLGHYGKWVRIFRLDMSEMVWVEVEDLGRHVLFVSNTSCIAAIAPTSRMENKMAWTEVEKKGWLALSISNTSCIATVAPTSEMENKIYFPRLLNGGILFYSVDSGKYQSLQSEHYGTDYCNSKYNLWCTWIEPNWAETTLSNSDWS